MNYARWLPVHLRDMIALETLHPIFYQEFSIGNFVVRKTENSFSNIAIDQAHEQNKSVVKVDGDAIDVTEDPSALRRWVVAGPEVSKLVEEFSSVCGISPNKKSKHHEEAHATQTDFLQKVKRPQAILAEMGNPFEEESSELYALDTKDVIDTQVAENMARLPDTGKKKYSNFMNSLNNREKSGIDEPLNKNKCALFNHKGKQDATSSKSKLDILQNDYSVCFLDWLYRDRVETVIQETSFVMKIKNTTHHYLKTIH